MKNQLDHHYRPKVDRQRLRDLIQEAWGAYHDREFPETGQLVIREKITALLEQRFPPDDMAILAKYGQARAATNVSLNIYHPERNRWDVYASVAVSRPVLCPQGCANFSVGGPATGSNNRLPAEFEPYFDRVREARDAYIIESNYTPERTNGHYPTWREIAAQLPVAGKHIIETLT